MSTFVLGFCCENGRSVPLGGRFWGPFHGTLAALTWAFLRQAPILSLFCLPLPLTKSPILAPRPLASKNGLLSIYAVGYGSRDIYETD
jgi:hypothetical protein